MHIRSVVAGGLTALGVALLLAACGGGGAASNNSLPAKNAALPAGEVDSGAKPNPDGFAFPNFGAAATPAEFNANDVSTMFSSGSEICVQTGGDCELSAEARAWARMVNQARVSGHCEGLAVLASTRFIGKELPKTITLAQQDEITHAIMRAFATQFLNETQEATKAWAKKRPSEIVNALVDSLKVGAPKFTLGVYTDSGGHAVLPYAVEFPSVDIARIMVYDSNWPGMDRYVEVNLAKETWQFSFSGADPASDPQVWQGGKGDLDITPLDARVDGTCPFCNGKVGVQKSLLLIRSAKPDWSIQSADGELTAGSQLVGESVVRPLRSALPPRPDVADASRQGPTDYLVFTNLSGKGASIRLGSTARVVGVTPQAIFEIDAQSTAPSVEIQISDVQIAVDDPQVGLTLSNENSVASSAGNTNTVSVAESGITVNITTDDGEALEFKTSEEAPAIDVRTGSASGATEGAKYEVFTQVSPSETEHLVVTDDGEKNTTRQQGQLENQKTTTKMPEVLDAPLVKAGLPPPDAREFTGKPDLASVPVETTTTTTVAATTTTTEAPAPSTTVAPTTTTTVAPTTTTTTIPIAPTAAPSESDVLALPLVDPAQPLRTSSAFNPGDEVTVRYSGLVPRQWVQLIVASTPEVLDTAIADASGSVSLSGRVPASLLPGSHHLAVFQPQSKTGVRQAMTYTLPVFPPSAPRSVSVVVSNAQATVSWAAPSSNGGAAITSYLVTSSPGVHSCTYTVPAGSTAAPSCVVTGLTNGRSYTFTVSATNSAGTSEQSAISASAIPVTTPSAPMSVVGTSGDSRVNLSWSTPLQNGGTEITDYEVWYSAFSIGPFVTFSDSVTSSRTAVVTGLTNGSTYYFKVVAVNAVGLGETSAISAGVVPAAVPSVPTSVSAARGDELATISWTAPANNGATITRYTVTSNPGGLTCIWVSGPLSCDVLGLANGTSYTFTVSATNSVGEGNPSSASQAVVPAAVPGMPTSVSGSSGNGSVALTWSAPSSVGGSGILDYVIEYSSNSGASWVNFADGTSTTASATVTGLTNGTSYIFRVAATNTVGSSQYSAVSSGVIPATTPGAPTGVSGVGGSGQVTVSWSAPVSTGGATISSYTVTSSGGQSCSWSSGPLSCVVTGLGNGVAYTFTVTASNSAGEGTSSTASSSVTPLAAAPVLGTVSSGNGQITFNWGAVTHGGDTYRVYWGTDPTWASAYSFTSSGGSMSYTATGLTNGTTYYVRVAGWNNGLSPQVGTTAWSVNGSAVPSTTPGAPTIGSITASNASLSVAFTAGDSGGSSITSYKYSTDGGTTFRTRAAGTTASPLVISTLSSDGTTALVNGTSYSVQIKAVNANGDGVASASTGAVPSTTPGAPTIGSITASNASLSVAFTAGDSGGSSITSYKYSTDGGTTFRTRAAGTTASPLVISTLSSDGTTALVNGTSYSVQIKAVNANGDGAVAITTAAIAGETPGAPTSVSGTKGNGSLTVAWVAPNANGSAITDYEVYIGTTASGSFTLVADSVSTVPGATVSGLTNGTTYYIKVAAVNSLGAGTMSAVSAAITPSAPCSSACAVGDVGPAGGIVFMTPATAGNATGRYFEAAPAGWNGTGIDLNIPWCNATSTLIGTPSALGTAIGTGSANTDAIVAVCSTGAAKSSRAYSGGGASNWFLPSIDELLQMYANRAAIGGLVQTTQVGTGLATTTFWSSSEVNASQSKNWSFLTNGNDNWGKNYGFGVRPIRTFSAPSAPTISSITASDASLSVAFTAGAINGSAITSYKYSTDGGTTFMTRAAGTTASPLVISTLSTNGTSPLVNGTTYNIQIKAVNAIGDGTATSSTAATPRLPAAAILVSTQPVGGTSGAALTTQPVVRIVDSTNATVATSTASVTVTASGGTLGGTTTVAAVNGVATFTNLWHRTAGTYTLTFASTSLTSATSADFTTSADACATGGACYVGNTGPGGGTVFYAASGTFTSTGSDCNTSCKYLETTAIDQLYAWSTAANACYDSGSASSNNNCETNSVYSGTSVEQQASRVASTAIGMGMANTNQIYSRFTTAGGSAWSSYAAGIAWAYSNNGKTDWFMPSKDELHAMCKWAANQHVTNTTTTCNSTGSLNTGPGAINFGGYYFSSSEYSAGNAEQMNFANGFRGNSFNFAKLNTYRFRPVRAFSASSAIAVTTQPAGSTSGAALATQPVVRIVDAVGNTVSHSTASVTVSASGGTLGGTTTVTAVNGVATFTNLTHTTGGTYTLSFASTSPSTLTSVTSSSFTTTAAPDAPTGLSGTAGDTQVALTWTAPAYAGSSAITDYIVQYSSNSGSTWTTFTDGVSTTTSSTVTGLTNGTSYLFKVSAVNSVGTGSAVTSSAVTPATTPSAVTALTSDFVNTSRADLSWSAPISAGTSAITDYVVTVTAPGGGVTVFADGVSTSTSVSVTGLSPSGVTCNGAYTIGVQAKNDVGLGPSTPIYVYPGRIGGPTSWSSVVSDGQIALSWAAPSTNNSGYSLRYSLERKSITHGTSFSAYGLSNSTETSFIDTGATNGVTWQYRVTARSSTWVGGCYGSSIHSPVAPSADSSAPTSVAGTAGNGVVNLTWSAPASGIPTDYVVSYSTSSTGTFTTYDDGVSTTTSAVVSGLTNGTTYYFKVAAVVGGVTTGTNRVSGALTPANTPDAPTNVSGFAYGADVNLSWTAPVGNGGAEVSDYVVQYATSATGPFTTFDDGVLTFTTATVTGLSASTEYFFKVAAVNRMGNSSYSMASSSVTTNSCSTGGVCVVGDTGPAGGKVFYVSATPITYAGPYYNNQGMTFKYIEASPADAVAGYWGPSTVPWGCRYSDSYPYSCDNVSTQSDSTLPYGSIGYGFFNTQDVLQLRSPNNYTAVYVAGHYSANYNGSIDCSVNTGQTCWSYSNWHLPSNDELLAMYAMRTEIGLTVGKYWSSTEWASSPLDWAYALDASTGEMDSWWKGNNFYVRPVRYFS